MPPTTSSSGDASTSAVSSNDVSSDAVISVTENTQNTSNTTQAIPGKLNVLGLSIIIIRVTISSWSDGGSSGVCNSCADSASGDTCDHLEVIKIIIV